MKLGSRAEIIAACPESWTLTSDADSVCYKNGITEVQHEFDGDRLRSTSYLRDGECHRDPAEGPAIIICHQNGDVYYKYFYMGQPCASPEGHFGKVIIVDPPFTLYY